MTLDPSDTHTSDEELLLRFRDTGDQELLARLFDRTSPILMRFALRLASQPNDADDLVQSTYVTALDALSTYETRGAPVAWLIGILNNHARARYREARRAIDEERISIGESEDPAQAAHIRDLNQQIRDAIRGLSSPYREVVELHFDRGLAPREVAGELSRSPSTVGTQLARGLEKLRARLPEAFGVAALRIGGFDQALATCRERLMRSTPAPATPASSTPRSSGASAHAAPTARRTLMLAAAVITIVGALTIWWTSTNPEPTSTSTGRGNPTEENAAPADTSANPSVTPAPRDDVTPNVATTANLEVTVVSESDGSPIPGAPLRMMVTARAGAAPVPEMARGVVRTARTDAEGRATFPDLPKGRALLLQGFSLSTFEWVDIGATSRVTLEIPSTRRISGRIVGPSGSGVANAEVWMSSSLYPDPGLVVAHSDERGAFQAILINDDFAPWIWCEAPGHAPSPARRDKFIEDGFEMEVALEPTDRTLRVRALSATGDPLARAVVRVWNVESDAAGRPMPAAYTTDDGVAEFACGTAAHAVVARLQGHTPTLVFVDPEESNVEVRTTPGATIFGRLTTGGHPLARRRVVVEPALPAHLQPLRFSLTRYGWTDDDGAFRMENVRAGASKLLVLGPRGKHEIERSLELVDHEQREIDLVIDTGKAVAGYVFAADGQPLVGAHVSICPPEVDSMVWHGSYTRTDENGRFEVRGLRGDEHRLGVVHEPTRLFVYAASRIVRNDEDLEIRLTPDEMPTATIRGQLEGTDPAVPWSLLFLREGIPLAGEAFAQPDGSFEIGGLAAGRYTLLCRPKSSGDIRSIDVFDVTPGATVDVPAFDVENSGWLRVRPDRPLPEGSRVFVTTSDGRHQRNLPAPGPTDDGRFQLPSGGWTLSVIGPDIAPIRQTFDVVTNNTTDVPVKVTAAPTVRLRILRSNEGGRSAQAWVAVRDSEGVVVLRTISRAATTHEVSLGLEVGTYSVEAVTDYDARVHSSFTVQPGGDNTATLDLR